MEYPSVTGNTGDSYKGFRQRELIAQHTGTLSPGITI